MKSGLDYSGQRLGKRPSLKLLVEKNNLAKRVFHRLQDSAARLWAHFLPNVVVIGVTGSYGKTSAVGAIAQILSEKFTTFRTDINLDTIFNIPLTILKLRPKHRFLVLEYGVDHIGEMNRHLGFVRPKVGILTGITPVHAEKDLLGSLEGIINEKKKMLDALPKDGLAVLNWEDQKVRELAKKIRARIIRYGYNRKECDYTATDIKVSLTGTSFNMVSKNGWVMKMRTGLIGRHFVQSCLAAAAVGEYFGVDKEEISNGLKKLKPATGRFSIEPGPLESILINDSLRANPASVLAGLETLKELSGKRKIAVLGEMGELGQYAEKMHRDVGRRLADLNIDFLVGIGPLQKLTTESATASGVPEKRVFWAKDVAGAAEILEKIIKPGDLLYLKGSLLRHLERVVMILNKENISCHEVACHCYDNCRTCDYKR